MEDKKERWALALSVDWFHLSVGIKVNVPRATKHSFVRWSVKIRVLFFGAELQRLNEARVPKNVAPVAP